LAALLTKSSILKEKFVTDQQKIEKNLKRVKRQRSGAVNQRSHPFNDEHFGRQKRQKNVE
jgi:hypothetical protein